MLSELIADVLNIGRVETLVLTAVAVFIGSVIAGRFVDWFIVNVIRKIAAKTETKLDDILCEVLHRPITILAYLFGAWAGFYTLGFTPENLGAVYPFYKAMLVMFATYVVITTSDNFWDLYDKYLTERTSTTIDDLMVPFARKIVPIFAVVIGFLIILKTFNYDITPILAGAGIIGIVLGMAAQTPLSNFFAGLLIIFDRPFKVNDRIEIGKDYVGDVTEIGNFTTKLRNLENNILIIPNNKISATEVINHIHKDKRYNLFVNVGVAYGTDHKKVKKILLSIAHRTEGVLKDPAPEIFFKEFAASSLNFLMIVMIENSRIRMRVLDSINCSIQEEFAKAKIEIPFPRTDVYMVK